MPEDSPVGRRIEPFQLRDHLGTVRSLKDWQDAPAVAVVFLGTECPLARLYGRRLNDLAKEFEPQGVQFVGINSNQYDTLVEIGHFARTHGIDFPILKDPGNKVADAFGAVRTPEAFVLDKNLVVRYWGRIDDQYGVGYSRSRVGKRFVADALTELLAGKAVSRPAVEAVGCHISRVVREEPGGDVTYSKHIAPILQKHCVRCHRPGQIGPFTLTSHEDASAWAETMAEVIRDQRMPPWHADSKFPEHGGFRNDARMSAAEKELVYQWVDNGVPEGDPSDLPPPVEFTEGWRIEKPDLVIKMPREFRVPARGTVEYQYFTVDPGFKEDVWVCGSEGRPGNRSVVHHLILFFTPPGQQGILPQDPLFNAVASFVPGMPAGQPAPGVAVRIPAGSKLHFQMHYTPNGHEQTDLSEAGLLFAKPEDVKQELKIGAVLNFRFAIPPGADNYRVEASRTLDEDTLLHAMVPHMHLRGKSFRFTAAYPNGREEILLDVPHYDFNWQNVYELKEPKRLPAGTELKCVAHFDNSERNLVNPDPTKTVTWGEQTWQEMMVGSYYYTRAEQDLSLGPPQVKPLGDGRYEVRFRYRPPAGIKADAVYLAGEFNEWKPTIHRMNGPDKDGFFTTTVELPAGRHEYKFVINGDTWKPDPGNPQKAGFYGNSMIQVGRPIGATKR